ncbi:MAG: hypothetical protein COX62_03085 [Deltaproteobacteria bacterium CG_4_10_14_0_2_um_filter_43_8]|nr:MAG: hypothetical protein COV43_09180 [Deltaproteobacteria bacterium CG11_big_fil_rev_8_21_14_0_20_42_23]PJA21191.1 MAG: hypothetical protein COX62_03085 [Deltaproteobacteria bacterium CG_4_10_14_0_2_um_filter_43_8]PJC64801.1 MAG: hypothetical protein CO021_02455 [Deltaproteobacteria bacterium CG_4_9_14_0_2_um_filter_42_21]
MKKIFTLLVVCLAIVGCRADHVISQNPDDYKITIVPARESSAPENLVTIYITFPIPRTVLERVLETKNFERARAINFGSNTKFETLDDIIKIVKPAIFINQNAPDSIPGEALVATTSCRPLPESDMVNCFANVDKADLMHFLQNANGYMSMVGQIFFSNNEYDGARVSLEDNPSALAFRAPVIYFRESDIIDRAGVLPPTFNTTSSPSIAVREDTRSILGSPKETDSLQAIADASTRIQNSAADLRGTYSSVDENEVLATNSGDENEEVTETPKATPTGNCSTKGSIDASYDQFLPGLSTNSSESSADCTDKSTETEATSEDSNADIASGGSCTLSLGANPHHKLGVILMVLMTLLILIRRRQV